MRIPLSLKLISLVVTFLIAATFIFAKQSSELFEFVLVQREEYANMGQASSKANEIERLIAGAVDRAQVIGTLMAKTAVEKHDESSEMKVSFNKDKALLALDVLEITRTGPRLLSRQTKSDVFEKAGLDANFLAQLRTLERFPVEQVLEKKVVVRNGSYPKGYPLITIGLPLLRDDQGKVTHIALADIDLSYLQKPFSEESERVQFVFDADGTLLGHQDERKVMARHSMQGHPLVEKSKSDLVPRRQIQFKDPDSDELMIGAYVQIPAYGMTVVSQTPRSVILEPANEVRRKTFYLAGTIISIAIFCFFLFAGTLTGHLEILDELVREVERGNFALKAKDKVRFLFRDEVTDLASAIDRMTDGLKERDKVKSLFNKFHGSSITDDLLKKDLVVGGQKKEVAVFFSDIRGFTAYSESHTPEQVVEMLNEYFEVMVRIITKHKGVVDKFIGDAIMAVWGVPNSTEQDTKNALLACLEMRTALETLNQKRISRGQTHLLIGMGLHMGKVISGTIGSNERLEYTVIDRVGMFFIADFAGSAEVKVAS